MENEGLLDQGIRSNESDNSLSGYDKMYLEEAAKWSKFLGIAGFIFAGIILIAAFSVLFLGSSISKLGGEGSPLGSSLSYGVALLYLLIGIVYFLLSLYQFRFGTKMKIALNESDSEAMTEGLKNLKNYFKSSGIITAIVTGFYALVLVFGILGGMAALIGK